MSHVIIILDDNADCVANNFSSLATDVSNLKTKCHELHNSLTPLNSARNKRVHDKLKEIQDYLVARCDNPSQYEGQETTMQSEIADFMEQLDSLE